MIFVDTGVLRPRRIYVEGVPTIPTIHAVSRCSPALHSGKFRRRQRPVILKSTTGMRHSREYTQHIRRPRRVSRTGAVLSVPMRLQDTSRLSHPDLGFLPRRSNTTSRVGTEVIHEGGLAFCDYAFGEPQSRRGAANTCRRIRSARMFTHWATLSGSNNGTQILNPNGQEIARTSVAATVEQSEM